MVAFLRSDFKEIKKQMRKVCELFYAPVSGALPERQAEINDQAVDAIINFDAKTLKTLCETEGLDINKISMRQGLPEISASWLLFIFLSIAVDNGVKSAKEFIISPTKLPNFLKELQKMGCLFTEDYPRYSNPYGDNVANLVLRSECFSYEQRKRILKLLATYSVKLTKCQSMELCHHAGERYRRNYETNNTFYNEFAVRYNLERELGFDFYGEGMERDPNWARDCLQLTGATYIPKNDSENRIQFVEKKYSTDELRRIFSDCAGAGLVVTDDLYTKFISALMKDKKRKKELFNIMIMVFSSSDFDRSNFANKELSWIYSLILENCFAFTAGQFFTPTEIAGYRETTITWETGDITFFNSLLLSIKSSTLADWVENNGGCVRSLMYQIPHKTPIFYHISTIKALCEILLRHGRSPQKLFSYMITDLLDEEFWRRRPEEVINRQIDMLADKIDLLQSYGWDINGINEKISQSKLWREWQSSALPNEHPSFYQMLAQDNPKAKLGIRLLFLLSEKGLVFSEKTKKRNGISDLLTTHWGEARPGLEDIYRQLVLDKKAPSVVRDEIEVTW